MVERIKGMIARERKKSPDSTLVGIFFRRFIQLVKDKYYDLRMVVTKDGTFISEDALWMCSLFPKKILDVIIADKKPGTLLDVGCGTGVSLKYLLDNGIDATGVENSAIAIAKSPAKDHIIRHNLSNELNLNKKFDLVWCFEVIEHIHPDFEKNLLQTLVNHSNYIVLSAARPGQGGHGHFNEKEPAYWIQKFSDLGYSYDSAFTQKLKDTGEMHSDNLLCFSR